MLNVEGLSVSFRRGESLFPAVRNLQFTLSGGEALAIVGESGSGKTLTALAVMGLLPEGAVARGRIYFCGRRLTIGRETDWAGVRGKAAGMVFQNPAAALNPVIKVGRQVSEILEFHCKISRDRSLRKTLRLFSALGILPARQRFHQYPHQLSGGLQQRVMLAIAGALEPPLLIADEPTSALDLIIQSQILDLLTAGIRERGRSLLLITHDLGVVARAADRVLVMCAGVKVEEATVTELFDRAYHPYTRMLLEAVPGLDRKPSSKPAPRSLNVRLPAGCPFLPHCRQAMDKCLQLPSPRYVSPTHRVCCHVAGGSGHA